MDDEKPFHVKRIPETLREKVFDRFKNLAAKLLFSKEEQAKIDHHLTGRILTLQDDAVEVLKELNTIKEDLEKEADADLISSIEEVVNPIIRDVQRLQRIKEPDSVDAQLHTLKQYAQWIDRAKPWALFFSRNLSNRTAVIQAVVKHTIKNSAEIIERDLQVIHDYEKHKLIEANVSEEERQKLQHEIEKDLSVLIEKLTFLQYDTPKHPESLSLKQLETWKKKVASHREEYYNESLQAIDKVIAKMSPASITPGVSPAETNLHDHVIRNLNRIVEIEQTIIPILDEIEKNEPLDSEMRKELNLRLAPLETHANLLHQELQLTPELEERLQAVQQLLDEAKMRLVA